MIVPLLPIRQELLSKCNGVLRRRPTAALGAVEVIPWDASPGSGLTAAVFNNRSGKGKTMAARGLTVLTGITLFAAGFGGVPAVAQNAPAAEPTAFIKKWDRSGKGLLDLKGVLNAAMVKFELLDKDHKGRLSEQQLAYALTPQEFAVANPDGDTTIGAEEWFDLVRRRFHAANPDNDGSLTPDELKTPQGQALLKLLS